MASSPPSGSFGDSWRRGSRATGLRHRHHLQQVAVRILEVEAAPTPAAVDPPVGMAVGIAARWDPARLDATEDCLELLVADVKGVVVASANLGIEAGPAPFLGLVGEVEGQARVDAHGREVAVARLDPQAEYLGEELRRGALVLCGHDGVIQTNHHAHLRAAGRVVPPPGRCVTGTARTWPSSRLRRVGVAPARPCPER